MNYGNIVVQSIVLMFELLQHDEARGLTVWQNVNPPPFTDLDTTQIQSLICGRLSRLTKEGARGPSENWGV